MDSLYGKNILDHIVHVRAQSLTVMIDRLVVIPGALCP
jgi:hypothetical protein